MTILHAGDEIAAVVNGAFEFNKNSKIPNNYSEITIHSNNDSMELWIHKTLKEEKKEKFLMHMNLLAKIPRTNHGSSFHKEIFGGTVDGDVYVAWLKKRIHYVMYSNKKTDAPAAFRYKYYKGEKKGYLILYDNYFKFESPERYSFLPKIEVPIGLSLSILIHEANHFDHNKHIKCDLEKIKNKHLFHSFFDHLEYRYLDMVVEDENNHGCDENYRGSYGVELIFSYNLKTLDTRNIDEPYVTLVEEINSNFTFNLRSHRILDIESRKDLNIDYVNLLKPKNLLELIYFYRENNKMDFVSQAETIINANENEALLSREELNEAYFRGYVRNIYWLLESGLIEYEKPFENWVRFFNLDHLPYLKIMIEEYNFELNKNYSLNRVNISRMNLLHKAILLEDIDAIKRLINMGIDNDAKIYFLNERAGYTPLELLKSKKHQFYERHKEYFDTQLQ